MDMEFYKERGVTFTVGSHMYGLNTENSDTDMLTVYFDPQDYLVPLPYREHPQVKEMHNNDTKLYSLDYFAELIVKGNPNLVEVARLTPTDVGTKDFAVMEFIAMLGETDDMVHRGVLSAYMGHLNGIVKEMRTKGITPKRLSHALRVAYSVQHIARTGQLFRLPEHPALQKQCLEIKLTEYTRHYEKFVLDEISTAEFLHKWHVEHMRTNESLKKRVTGFFKHELYQYVHATTAGYKPPF